MLLDYKNLSIYSKDRCPYFTGVKEHGSKAIIKFDFDNYEMLMKKYGCRAYESPALHIFEDGTVYITSMQRDYSREEWVEDVEFVFDGKKADELRKDLDEMLDNNYVMNNRGLCICSFNRLMDQIKKNENLIMF